MGVSSAPEMVVALGKSEKRTWGKERRDAFFHVKDAAQVHAHSTLRSSGVGCNAVRVEMKAVCLREGFEVYENKALLHYQCPAELFPQCASNNITPHRKSINTLKLWIHKDKPILAVFAFLELAFVRGTWKKMLTRQRVNTNNYCVFPMCYPSGTCHFKSLKFNYIFAFGTLDSHSPMKKSIWEGFKLI